MSKQIEQDLAAEPMVMVFGTYRANWTSPSRVKFVERICRTLWKRGPMTTGHLAGYLILRLQDELFQQALAALVEWKIISVTKRPWGSAYVAELAPLGREQVWEYLFGILPEEDGVEA